MSDPNEILQWGSLEDLRCGTLKDYITDCYPLYAELGLFTWGEIYEWQKKRLEDD